MGDVIGEDAFLANHRERMVLEYNEIHDSFGKGLPKRAEQKAREFNQWVSGTIVEFSLASEPEGLQFVVQRLAVSKEAGVLMLALYEFGDNFHYEGRKPLPYPAQALNNEIMTIVGMPGPETSFPGVENEEFYI